MKILEGDKWGNDELEIVITALVTEVEVLVVLPTVLEQQFN